MGKLHVSFTNVIRRAIPHNIRLAVKYFVQVLAVRISYHLILQGVQYIHSCNVVHHDLHNDNIVITNSGIVKIIDFGLLPALLEVYAISLQVILM